MCIFNLNSHATHNSRRNDCFAHENSKSIEETISSCGMLYTQFELFIDFFSDCALFVIMKSNEINDTHDLTNLDGISGKSKSLS